MDNQYMDALLMSLLAFGVLLVVAFTVMLVATLMHRMMLFKEKHGVIKLPRMSRHSGEDDKTRVVLAAAVAAYLKAEEENRR